MVVLVFGIFLSKEIFILRINIFYRYVFFEILDKNLLVVLMKVKNSMMNIKQISTKQKQNYKNQKMNDSGILGMRK